MLKPAMVATHSFPEESCTISLITSLEIVFPRPGLNILKECPSYRLSPFLVPIHKKPVLSFRKQVTRLSESPFSSVSFLKKYCPSPVVENSKKPIVNMEHKKTIRVML